ncbi:MAG: cupin domain-containing protein [Nitrosomonadales bacterium]|nr:cupin domain-containing protein [Nitrosomonadales bacterium]
MQNTQQNLNDFLHCIHLGSEMYYGGQLCDAWKLSIPGSGATSSHLVSHGDVWLHKPAAPMQLLQRHRKVLFVPPQLNDAAR